MVSFSSMFLQIINTYGQISVLEVQRFKDFNFLNAKDFLNGNYSGLLIYCN